MRILPGLCSLRYARRPKFALFGAVSRAYHLIVAPIFGCVTMTSVTQTAFAETKESSMVVISAAQTTPMLRRLQQEIEALGFSVQIENRGFTERPEVELSTRGAVAAVEVVTTIPGFIALYVLEPKTARIIRQELPIEAPNDPTATELVTTRAVELLRAARLEVGAAAKQPTPALPPVAATATPAPKTQQPQPKPKPAAQLLLGAGPGISYVPQWRASSNFGVTATYISRWGLGWVGGLSGALTPARLQIPEVGQIDAFPTAFRVGGTYQAFPQAPLGLRLSSGMEWSQLKFTGQVTAPYAGSSVYLSTLAPWIALGANIHLSSLFQLVTQVSGSWAMPRTVVRVAGQELRDWGQPTLSGTITVEWRSL